jgi:hypothetical protein
VIKNISSTLQPLASEIASREVRVDKCRAAHLARARPSRNPFEEPFRFSKPPPMRFIAPFAVAAGPVSAATPAPAFPGASPAPTAPFTGLALNFGAAPAASGTGSSAAPFTGFGAAPAASGTGLSAAPFTGFGAAPAFGAPAASATGLSAAASPFGAGFSGGFGGGAFGQPAPGGFGAPAVSPQTRKQGRKK